MTPPIPTTHQLSTSISTFSTLSTTSLPPIIIKYNHMYCDEWINLEIQFFKETLSPIIIKYKYTFYDEWIPSETHFPRKHFPQDTMPRTKSKDSRPKDRLQKSRTIPHISQPLSLHYQMKTKSRDFCPKDKLLYGGMRVKREDRPQKSWTISYRSPPLSLHDQMKTTEERHNHICCNNQRVKEARE